MIGMKYVIFDDDTYLLFPSTVQHINVLINQGIGLKTPISAGFCMIKAINESEMKISCYGESVSLDLESRPEEDSEIIERGYKFSCNYF